MAAAQLDLFDLGDAPPRPGLDFHPIADRYPLLEGDAFDSFKASVRANGQKVKIVLFEGKILDGRNRYRACTDLGIEPQFDTFMGTEAEAAVYSDVLNLDRRHLTREQVRAVIAFKIAENPERSNRDIADEVKVSHNTVQAVREKVSGGQVDHLPKTVTGRDGKKYTAKPKPVVEQVKAEAPAPAPAGDDHNPRPVTGGLCVTCRGPLFAINGPWPSAQLVCPKCNPPTQTEVPDESDAALPVVNVEEHIVALAEPVEPVELPKSEVLGKGVFVAHEAINLLRSIPADDQLRARGYQIVVDWITAQDEALHQGIAMRNRDMVDREECHSAAAEELRRIKKVRTDDRTPGHFERYWRLAYRAHTGLYPPR